ncbi:tetratricopeptide repeat protein [Nitrincola tapanii]|uniref:Uncharacterized protein n=1 Tax=Nitrincola tapanii TaxID=1708751 RepID=A0A5A9W015_9GAMM|nr:hypothetical protein [Nitrincola tapanii]KAA0874090.1 hypothetical protein E1H14_09940 [Nitrincola tapanii]
MKPWIPLIILAGILSGCTAQNTRPMVDEQGKVRVTPPPSCNPLSNEETLVMSMSRDMVEAGRLHAALANLERMPETSPEARLRKAQILRLLGRYEAEAMFASLTNSCVQAQAHHGLGQMHVSAQRYPEGLKHLRIAVALEPTNDAMRNDLGVAHLNMRQLKEAQFEFLTAMELNEADKRPAVNLLTSLLYQGNREQAARLMTRYNLDQSDLREAAERAQRMQLEDQPQKVTAPAPAPAPAPAMIQPSTSNATTPSSQTTSVPGIQRVAPSASRPVVPIVGQ